MKRYKRDLLNHLNGSSSVGDEEPLKNVKDALGALRNIVGNPMFKAEITLQINTLFAQAGVGVILPAALPANLQTTLPAYLLGLTDYYGGFLGLTRIVPITPPWQFVGFGAAGINVTTGIVGYNVDPLGALIPIGLQRGDMILQYADGAPGVATNFAIVRIRCNNISYGTFLNSFVSDLMTVNMLRLIVPAANINQLINPLIFGYQTLFGKLSSDSVDPRMYKTPEDFQNQIADIPLTFPVDKNLMLGFQLDVFCQQMSIVLAVQKVEPLTHK